MTVPRPFSSISLDLRMDLTRQPIGNLDKGVLGSPLGKRSAFSGSFASFSLSFSSFVFEERFSGF